MNTKIFIRSLASVFALAAATAFADAQSDLESKIANEVAGKYRAITAKANSLDAAWIARQSEKAAAAKDSSVGKDIVFLGDDAMAGWETTGAGAMSAFGSAKIFNLGYKGDCTEHVLWRVTEGGELSGYTAKAVVFTVGANNSAVYMRAEESPVGTLYAIIHTLAKIRAAQPNATIIVNSILPRGANASDDVRRRIGVLNEDLRKWVMEKGSGYVWCDLTDTFADKANGEALKTQYFESDKVSLNASGYAAWAAVLDDYVAAAANGTAMPASLVCERRPLQGSAPDSTYGTSRTYPGLGYWDKLANFLYGNGVQHQADVVLLGDSITEKWAGPEMSSSMYGLADKVMNLGNSGDMTENLLWRLENGELEGYTTKIFNLLIGTNNTQEKNPLDSPENIAAGVRKVIDLVLEKHPEAKITLVPILPFGHVSKPDWGRMLDATNQAANAIIRTFADNQRVFLVDIDNSKFYNQDGTFNAQMYVSDEAALHYLHLSAQGYSEIVAPAVKAAIAAAGETGVVFPSVGSVSAAVSGTTATLTVSDITKGTTKSGASASSATVFCKLDSAAETSCAGTTVALADLADGPHTCAVWVENEDGLVSAPKRVTFAVNSKENEVGWSIAPMDSTGTGFRSSGTTVFANGYGYSAATVNGVEFSVSTWLPSEDKVSFSSAQAGHDGWGENNPIFAGGWYWNKTADASMDLTATFKGLTEGHKYVAQMLVSYLHSDSTKVMSVSAGELAPVTVSDSGDCKYGAIVTRVFVASGATEDVKITIDGSNTKLLLKAIQLRDLGEKKNDDDDPTDPAVTPVWPDYVPCTPSNRYTIEGAIPVVNQLYREQLSSLNDDRFPLPREFDLVTIGDSITDNWDTRDKVNYFALADSVFNLGIGGDRIEQLLWRLEEGGCNNFKAKYITLLIGTNNSYQRRMEQNVDPDKPEEMAKGIERVLWDLKTGHPEAKILLMPILPYDKLHDERGAVCRANNENVNDLIINFVDNKQVFWLDIRGGFLNADGTFHDDYWSASGEAGSDGKGHYLHPSSKGYSEVFDPAVRAAMKKIASDVSADTAQVTDPTLGYASASVDSWNSQVTMTLSGVYVGTDSSAVKASSYKIEYKLDDGEWTTALENQTLTRNSFVIENVAVGQHTCEIKVTTSAGKSVTTVSEFVMGDAWMAEALGATSASVRTEGELVYAYANGSYKVADVTFTAASGSVDDSNIKWPFGLTAGSTKPDGLESGGYCDLLTHCWWMNPGTGGKQETITLKGLTPGNEYLVQLFSYRSSNNDGFVYVVGTQADTTFIRAGGDGWPYGGTLVGKFTADATTKDIVIQIEGLTALNGIQVRSLGSGEPIPVNPSIGSVSASVSGSTATISLKGVVKGTDDEAVAATSYSVSYSLTNAPAVVALSNQSAATAEFDISDLADGDYTCSVAITTDKGKTSVAKSVNFTVKTSTPGGDDDPDEPVVSGWTAEPMDSAGAKFSTKGTFKYAYATQGVTVNGISFTRQITLVDSDSIAFSPADYSFGGVFMNEGVSGDFGLLLGNGWYWKEDGVNARTVTLTLKNLTSGKKYLVQVLSHTMWNDDLVVSAGGCTPQHVHGSDEASGKYGALLTGVFTASAATQAVSISFANGGGEHPINAVQVRELGEGGDDPVGPVDPEEPLPVYTLTIPAPEHLSVASVKTNNVAVTGSGNDYSIVSNTQVTITFAAATGYQITGGNPVVVTVESNMTLAEFPTVQEKQGGDDPDVPTGWTGAKLGPDSKSVRTDGTLVYAYAKDAYKVGEVQFAKLGNVEWATYEDDNFKFYLNGNGPSPSAPSGTEAGGYSDLLTHCWWYNSGSQIMTLKNLKKDSTYLVQVFCYRSAYNDGHVTIDGETLQGESFITSGASDFTYGGTIIGVFKADAETKEVKINSTSQWSFNGVQVRELGTVGPTPADAPVIGGEGVDVPMAVSSDTVSITISNAAAGHTYGYRKSVTLEGLATAEVIKLDSPAEADGVLTLDIPKDPAEPTCFYQIVVE